jgi:hypothetical protein
LMSQLVGQKSLSLEYVRENVVLLLFRLVLLRGYL